MLSASPGTLAGSVGSVNSIKVLCEPEPVTATVFIDASYDGEVMTAVGNVDYTAGREARSQYNESCVRDPVSPSSRLPVAPSVVSPSSRCPVSRRARKPPNMRRQ